LRAVANSSVLISLSVIGQLKILKERFQQGILVPSAVWNEVVTTGKGQPGAEDVACTGWITVENVEDRALVSLLKGDIDEGEAEAITLCKEKNVEVVLLDEKDARRAAHRLGLKVLGTVGLLIWARRVGIVHNLKEHLDKLRSEAKFHLSREVYDEALRAVNEL